MGFTDTYITDEKYLNTLNKDGMLIKYSPHERQTRAICLAAVQQNGLAINFIDDQTNELCMAALRQNIVDLQYLKNQTPEICLAAVEQDGLALKYVEEQTEDICLAAVKQNSDTLLYVNTPTFRVHSESSKTIHHKNVPIISFIYKEIA